MKAKGMNVVSKAHQQNTLSFYAFLIILQVAAVTHDSGFSWGPT